MPVMSMTTQNTHTPTVEHSPSPSQGLTLSMGGLITSFNDSSISINQSPHTDQREWSPSSPRARLVSRSKGSRSNGNLRTPTKNMKNKKSAGSLKTCRMSSGVPGHGLSPKRTRAKSFGLGLGAVAMVLGKMKMKDISAGLIRLPKRLKSDKTKWSRKKPLKVGNELGAVLDISLDRPQEAIGEEWGEDCETQKILYARKEEDAYMSLPSTPAGTGSIMFDSPPKGYCLDDVRIPSSPLYDQSANPSGSKPLSMRTGHEVDEDEMTGVDRPPTPPLMDNDKRSPAEFSRYKVGKMLGEGASIECDRMQVASSGENWW